jgi:UPF0755 protein
MLSGRFESTLSYLPMRVTGRSVLKTFIYIAAGVLLAVGAVAAWQAAALNHYAHQAPGSETTPLVFSIDAGETFDRVAGRLASMELIRDDWRFKLLARIKGADKALKAGEYELSRSMTPIEILDALVVGRTTLYRLTIPEGFNLKQIAEEVQRQGMGDGAEFLAHASRPETAESFDIAAKTLEGYLFPDTYLFPRGVGKETIVARMVERFNHVFTEAWRQRAEELGLSVHEVVTLASIIEKETGDPSERPRIASVFHNRLKRGMRLESDPTVIYGIDDFDGNITRKHLRTPTAYNTYTNRGLPPGPIASPGGASLHAALYPETTDYLFFVSRKDRTHQFSRTIEEHNAAVRKYQLRRRRKPAS